MTSWGTVVEDDYLDRFGGQRLRAFMFWPRDQRRRDAFLVTQAFQAMGGLRHLGKNNAELISIVNDASAGLNEEDIRRLDIKLDGGLLLTAQGILQEVRNTIDDGLAEPHGGEMGVANAVGRGTLLEQASREGALYGAACGEILSYLVSMNLHHPEAKPSLNRATAILKAQAKRDGREIPPERDHTTMWTEWGGIAPLWAAKIMLMRKFGSEYLDIDEFGPRHLVIAGSNTLSRWCLHFKAKGSTKPLLTADRAIHFAKALPAPPLTARKLTDEQLNWAKEYKVRQ